MEKLSLIACRKNKGMTRQEIAEMLGKSVATIANWEQGTQVPDRANLMLLSQIYNIPIDLIRIQRQIKLQDD